MTMLSPLGRVPRRNPSARRRTHRPVPALVLLVALSVLAAVVWWKVLHRGTPAGALTPCQQKPTVAALSLDPHTVKVRVYNATDRAGLARTVAAQLRKRGFAIAATSNDPLGGSRIVRGVGELRYGTPGAQQAVLVSLQFPGITMARDPRTDSIVDVAVGPSFHAVATVAQVNQAKKKAAAAARRGAPSGC